MLFGLLGFFPRGSTTDFLSLSICSSKEGRQLELRLYVLLDCLPCYGRLSILVHRHRPPPTPGFRAFAE